MRVSAARRVAALVLAGVTLVASVACREEGAGIEVADLSFTGVNAVSDSQLRSILATVESASLPWGTKRYLNREQFEADLKRIVAFYADRGYPEARVASFDVKLSDDQKSVKLAVHIVEGEPTRVERVDLVGFEGLPEDHSASLRGSLPLQPQRSLDRALLQASREAALDELRDHGFPDASVRVEEAQGSTPRLRVVRLNAEPGPRAFFGPIEITGHRKVNEAVVRRQLTFKPGELYRQSKLRETQRKLYGLELFDFVNVEPVRAEMKAAEIPTRVTIVEGKHRKVNFSAGYGTEEKMRAEIDWRHVNFFGGGQTAGVLARYSSLDRGVRLSFRQPYVFSPRYALGLSGQYWHTDEPAYVLDTVGGRVTLSREFRRVGGPVLGRHPTTTVALTFVNEWEDYVISEEARNDPEFRDDLIALGFNPDTGADSGRLSALILDAGRNTTENLLDARHGYVAILHLERGGGWLGGDWDYRELSAEGRQYTSLGNVAVLALRARAGAIDPAGSDIAQVPYFKRYFLGGSTNLRGWGRFEVAPLNDSGLPIGGLSFFNFSTEIRFPLVGKLGAVVFLDGGNVWTNPWDFNLNDLRYDAGPGVRYNTPIGPVRFDVGFQLNPIPGLVVNGDSTPRKYRLHFSIGHAF
jgi:outer membrane protein assembly complex protein YaeT